MPPLKKASGSKVFYRHFVPRHIRDPARNSDTQSFRFLARNFSKQSSKQSSEQFSMQFSTQSFRGLASNPMIQSIRYPIRTCNPCSTQSTAANPMSRCTTMHGMTPRSHISLCQLPCSREHWFTARQPAEPTKWPALSTAFAL